MGDQSQFAGARRLHGGFGFAGTILSQRGIDLQPAVRIFAQICATHEQGAIAGRWHRRITRMIWRFESETTLPSFKECCIISIAKVGMGPP